MKAIYLSRSAVVGRPKLAMPSMMAFASILFPSGWRNTWTIVRERSRLAAEAKNPRDCRLFSILTRSTASVAGSPNKNFPGLGHHVHDYIR